MNEKNENARVRLLVIGALTSSPSGNRFSLKPKSFDETLKNSAVTARVKNAELRFDQLKSFRLASVIAAVPELALLSRLGEELGTPAALKLDPNEVVSRVRAASGEGPLGDRIAGLLVKPTAPEPSSLPAAPSAIDSIFAQADLPDSRPKNTSSALRQARAAIEDHVFSLASSVLRDEKIARLESAWRSLKLLAEAAGGDDIAIEALDANPEQAFAAARAIEDEPAFERPDLVLLLDPVERIEDLSTWAELGEASLAPVLASISDSVFGADLAALAEKTHVQYEAWSELRASDRARWLAVAVNRMVLALEGAGAARRVVFANAAVAVAASLLASFRNTGTFGRIIGPSVALRAPETWSMPSGREAGTSSPLEQFLGIQAQRDLAAFGLIALGAARNSDRVVLAAAPTLRRSSDAVPLPAQLLTGRIVRFASWCREQIPRDTPDEQLGGLFKEAAEVLLFPASQGGASLSAEVITQDGKKMVHVRAAVLATYGGAPFELEFALS